MNQMKTKIELPVLIIIRGIPGSGKTFLANKLAASIGTIKCVNLDPDATDYDSEEYKQHVNQQTKDGVDAKLHAYRFLRAKAYKAIAENKIIIWNQPFTDLDIMKKVTERLTEQAKLEGTNLPIIVLEVTVPKEIAWQRIQDRIKHGGHGPTENKFAQFFDQYKSATSYNYNCITINGLEDNDDLIQKIMDQANSAAKCF